MRLVSQQLNAAIEGNRTAPANFGLLFNKWLDFRDDPGLPKPVVSQDRKPLITLYGNGKKQSAEILKQRHLQQAAYCQAMEKVGWRSFIVHAKLTAPFVSGLGMAHPTETGLILDHTSGMPYIPAPSQKGVLRLAHLINALCDEDGQWLPETELEQRGVIKRGKSGEWDWEEDAASKTLFGFGGDKASLAGQLVVLDAYPLGAPELGEEILNPHYGDYYKGNRGPTEDQSPIPIKFLVVKQGTEFVFRLLLRTSFAKAPANHPDDQAILSRMIERNIHLAICEEGMGAKTALGFGRFTIIATEEPSCVVGWQRQRQADEEAARYPWRPAVLKIEAAADWGQLKQLLGNKEIQDFQNRTEIGGAVARAAEVIRKDKPKKWDDSRDTFLTEWLKHSGLIWQPFESTLEPPVETASSPEEQATLARIESLGDWGAWKQSGIAMDSLPRPALQKLREKFLLWKIKDGKADKPTTWKSLNKLLQSLK